MNYKSRICYKLYGDASINIMPTYCWYKETIKILTISPLTLTAITTTTATNYSDNKNQKQNETHRRSNKHLGISFYWICHYASESLQYKAHRNISNIGMHDIRTK